MSDGFDEDGNDFLPIPKLYKRPSRQQAVDRPGYIFNLTEKQMRELSTATMNELKNLHPITELPQAVESEANGDYFIRCLEWIEYRLSDKEILEYGRNCVISYLQQIYDRGHSDALKEAVEAVTKMNSCKFLKCPNIEENGKCFFENDPDYFGFCEKEEWFDFAKRAIESLAKK